MNTQEEDAGLDAAEGIDAFKSSCDALPTATGVNRHKKGGLLDVGAGPGLGKTLQGVVGVDPAFGGEPGPLSVTA